MLWAGHRPGRAGGPRSRRRGRPYALDLASTLWGSRPRSPCPRGPSGRDRPGARSHRRRSPPAALPPRAAIRPRASGPSSVTSGVFAGNPRKLRAGDGVHDGRLPQLHLLMPRAAADIDPFDADVDIDRDAVGVIGLFGVVCLNRRRASGTLRQLREGGDAFLDEAAEVVLEERVQLIRHLGALVRGDVDGGGRDGHVAVSDPVGGTAAGSVAGLYPAAATRVTAESGLDLNGAAAAGVPIG